MPSSYQDGPLLHQWASNPYTGANDVKYVNIKDYNPEYNAHANQHMYQRDIPVTPVIAIDEEGDDGLYCTDLPWFGSFGGLLSIAILVSLFAFMKACPSRLMTFPNYRGDYCGVDTVVKGMPYLYYPLDPGAGSRAELALHAAQCVTECPKIADVGKPMPVPMMQNEIDDANPGSSGIVVRYVVQSPMYATELEGGNLCVPLDASLRKVVFNETSTLNVQIRRLFGSIMNAWPAMIRDVSLSLIVFGFVTQIMMTSVPRLTLQLSIISLVLGIFATSAGLLWWGYNEAYTLPFNYSVLYSMSVLSSKVLGIATLVAAPLSVIFVLANWGVLWEGVTHFDSLKEVLKDLSGTFVAPIVLSLVGGGVILLWCRFVMYLCSYSYVTPINTAAMHSNVAVPFFQETIHLSWLICFSIFVLTLSSGWTLRIIRSAARYCGSYVAVVWYFAPALRCGCDERDVSGIEGVMAIQQAFTVSIGTNALYGLVSQVVDPIKVFFGFSSRRKSPHFTPPDGDQLFEAYPTTTPAESSETAQWLANKTSSVLPGAAAVCDFVHSAAIAEVILQGHNLIVAMDLARKRLVTRGCLMRPTVAGRFIGSYALFGSVVSLAVSLWSSFFTFLTVSGKSVFFQLKNDGTPRVEETIGFFTYTLPGSRYFVANPVAAGLFVFVIVYFVCDIFVGFVEGIVDGITYLYVVDLQAGVTDGKEPVRFGPVEEHPCQISRAPHQFKELLTRVLEQELGCSFTPTNNNGTFAYSSY